MSLVTPQQLNDYMNNPQWTDGQKRSVAFILDGVEGQLSGALSGAYLTPVEMHEVAPILPSGMLATRQPVFAVLSVDGVTVDDDHPLQSPWVLTEHRLRNISISAPPLGVLTLPSTPSAWGAANLARVENAGQATVRYMGGWGDTPQTKALILAILNKAKAITNNRFDDRIGTSSGSDSDPVIRPERETWSADELKPLGIFRNIGAYR